MSCISDGFRGRVIAQEAPLPLWNPGNVDRCASAIENTWTLVKDWGLSVRSGDIQIPNLFPFNSQIKRDSFIMF